MIPEEVRYTYTSRNIIELPDGSYLMGVGSGYGKDFRFRSTDQGNTWQVEKMRVKGFGDAAYEYSILQEGIFFRTESKRLLLFSRCDTRLMEFDREIPGLPEEDLSETSDSDHYSVEILFESSNDGRSWRPVTGIPILGCMYPSVCTLGSGFGNTLFSALQAY